MTSRSSARSPAVEATRLRGGGTELSVSILVETFNLSSAELGSITDCLRSLERQTYPIEAVREVLVLVPSDAASEELGAACSEFSWVRLISVEPSASYAELKAMSTVHGTGAIIVMCDSDCRYQPDWLENLLQPLSERPEVEIVGGETTTPINGPYELAIALTFVFPRFSGEEGLSPALWPWANNVAVRRSALERVPLPSGPLLSKGQFVVHGHLRRASRQVVWRQPRARAMHPVPKPSSLISRYVEFGEETVVLGRVVGDRFGRFYRLGAEPNARPLGRMRHLAQRARSVFGEDPRRLVHLPLALPVACVCIGAYVVGMIRAYLRFGKAPPMTLSRDAAR